MSSKNISIVFNEAEVSALAALVGQKWRLITGDVLDEYPNHLSAWVETFVVTDTTNLRLSISPFDFELEPGDDDDLGVMKAECHENAPIEKIEKAEVSFKFGGQVIQEVAIIRENITHTSIDNSDWRLSNDYGVIFTLESGVIAIYKSGYQGFFLDIAIGEKIDSLEIPNGADFWTSDLAIGEIYDVERSFIPLSAG
jgi:hypothetical protein